MPWIIGLAVVVALAAGLAVASEERPPEPAWFRMDDYRAPTPRTLSGATVIDTEAAEKLWREGRAVFVDVLPRPVKPANLPAGTLWRDRPRQSIPGSVWLPNVGYGQIDAITESYFRAGLLAAAATDLARPIVVFCEAECWMSWNAARRALALGHKAVIWFPDGTDGWSRAGLPLAPVEPWRQP